MKTVAAFISVLAVVHGVILDEEPGDEKLGDAAEAIKKLDVVYDGHANDPFFYRRTGKDDRLKAISEIEAKTGTDMAGIYGEMAPASFADMFEKVGAKPGMKYYDLGSGMGKSVILAHLMGLDSTGVELASQRWENSCEALRKLQKQGSLMEGQEEHKTGMRFLKGSFLEADFSDADIVFTDSVEFSHSMLKGLAKTAKKMKPGAKVISWQGLPGDGFKKSEPLNEPASWNQKETFTVQEVIGEKHGDSLAEGHMYASAAKASDTVCVL